MKLIEYLKAIAPADQRKRVLATMYFEEVFQSKSKFKPSEIRGSLVAARTPNATNWNVSRTLANAGALVHSDGPARAKLWELTQSGRTWVEQFAALPKANPAAQAAASEVANLRAQVSGIADSEARAFAAEAVDCLEIGAHRAAIVFMWVAAVHELQERIWAVSTPAAITAAAQTHNPRAKKATKRDDLVEYNEALLLQVAQDLSVIDKNMKTELTKALDLRNGSGHPNRLRPGEHKAKAHIEDIITMLF